MTEQPHFTDEEVDALLKDYPEGEWRSIRESEAVKAIAIIRQLRQRIGELKQISSDYCAQTDALNERLMNENDALRQRNKELGDSCLAHARRFLNIIRLADARPSSQSIPGGANPGELAVKAVEQLRERVRELEAELEGKLIESAALGFVEGSRVVEDAAQRMKEAMLKKAREMRGDYHHTHSDVEALVTVEIVEALESITLDGEGEKRG